MLRHHFAALGTALVIACLPAGCSTNGSPQATSAGAPMPPSHASGHRLRDRHAYDYYPLAQVYHDRVTEMYFWIDEGGSWRFGTRLPASITLDPAGPVIVEASADGPYAEHERIAAMHGRAPYGRTPSSSRQWENRSAGVPQWR